MSVEKCWLVYKLFHEAPNTPKEVRCVNCKIAAGGLSLLAAGGGAIVGYKMFKRNGLTGALLMCGSFCMIGAGGVMFRMASDHHHYNQQLIANRTEQIRRERLARQDAGNPTQLAS